MHDLVRDMGREVVRKEFPGEPGKRSRLIDPKDVVDVLHDNKGTDAIEGMVVNSNMLKNEPLSTKVFTMMVNLRILILDGVCLRGSFKYLSNKLRLLKLHNCQLNRIPSDFPCEKLVELDLTRSGIEEFQPNMQHFRHLMILRLDGCKQLKKMPNFTGAQSLQKLSFSGCSNLVKVHPSIGSLEKLVKLSFSECTKLKELPNSICDLKSLLCLSLSGCKRLKELPIDLGKLEQLRELSAYGSGVSRIPFSLGRLRNLKGLYLWSHQDVLPSKSKPQLLNILSRRTPAPDGLFPPSFANLCSLEYLFVSYKYLPEVDLRTSIESLTSLKNLCLPGISCYLQSLPFNLFHLSNLRRLLLENWQNLRALPELPPSLEELSTENCFSLEKIANISNLKKLDFLNIKNCKSLVELPGLESLESLRTLGIRNCSALSIPFENWYKACSEDDTVKIRLALYVYLADSRGYGTNLWCRIPTLLRQHGFFTIIHDQEFNIDEFNGVGVSVRSRTISAWIVKEPQYIVKQNHWCFNKYESIGNEDLVKQEKRI